jgi:hypothetical protein
VVCNRDFSNRNSHSTRRAQLDALNVEWLALMRAGRFTDAWRVSDLAQQLRADIDCSCWPRHEQFIWRGEPLDARRVLVRCYHGLGDTIQFVRFVPRVRARRVTLWVQPQLIPLLSSMRGIDSIEPLHDGAPGSTYDVDVELAELMHVLRVTPEVVASESPYLHVPPAELAANGMRRLRVGIVWAAGQWNARRSIPCELLGTLADVAGVEWYVLQRGPALCEWQHRFGTIPLIDGIVDEARLLRALDLLITVDTCSAHLAGQARHPAVLRRARRRGRHCVRRATASGRPLRRALSGVPAGSAR